MAITGHQTSKEVTRYTKGATQILRAAIAFQKLTQPTQNAKSVPLFATHHCGGTISRRKSRKLQGTSEKWQRVGTPLDIPMVSEESPTCL